MKRFNLGIKQKKTLIRVDIKETLRQIECEPMKFLLRVSKKIYNK